MTILSDFAADLVTLSSIAVDGSRPAVRVRAITAQISNGEGIAITVNDGFSDLALGGDRYRRPTEIQIDIYTSTSNRLYAIKDQIIDRYHGTTRTLGDTDFQKMTVTFSAESASTLNDTVYRAIVTLEVIT